jgi:hypothetical protein
MKKPVILGLIALFFLLALSSIQAGDRRASSSVAIASTNPFDLSNYNLNSGPTLINGVPALDAFASDGDGSALHPYVITGQIFDGAGSGNPLTIQNTLDSYIKLTNCYFNDSTGTGETSMCLVQACNNMLIDNCTIFQGFSGLALIGCDNIRVTNCRSVSGWPVYCESSSDLYFENDFLNNTDWSGGGMGFNNGLTGNGSAVVTVTNCTVIVRPTAGCSAISIGAASRLTVKKCTLSGGSSCVMVGAVHDHINVSRNLLLTWNTAPVGVSDSPDPTDSYSKNAYADYFTATGQVNTGFSNGSILGVPYSIDPGFDPDLNDTAPMYRVEIFGTVAPLASFAITGHLLTGEKVTFTFNGSTGGLPCTYSWDFDDGTAAATATTTHKFRRIGVFYITLTVTNIYTVSSSKTLRITITDLGVGSSTDPNSDDSGSPDLATVPLGIAAVLALGAVVSFLVTRKKH